MALIKGRHLFVAMLTRLMQIEIKEHNILSHSHGSDVSVRA